MKYLIYFFIFLSTISFCACKKTYPKGTVTPVPPPRVPTTIKEISSFTLKAADNVGLSADVVGVINEDTIFLSIPYGVNLTSLNPSIKFYGMSINPDSGVVQNFTSSIKYVVTAEDKTEKIYFTKVKVIVKSTVLLEVQTVNYMRWMERTAR